MNVSGVTMQHQTASEYLHQEFKKNKEQKKVEPFFKDALQHELDRIEAEKNSTSTLASDSAI